jgi:hypothetical protein
MNDSRVFGEGEEGNHGVLNLPLAAQQLLEDWRVIGQDELMGLELVALTSDGNVGKLVALVKSSQRGGKACHALLVRHFLR